MSEYKPNISVSRLDTWEKCARYDHFQVVQRIPVPPRKAATAGEADHLQIENWSKGKIKTSELTGAASVIAQYYPLPLQDGVRIEESFSIDYAGGILHGKIDLSTTKDIKLWGARATIPKGLSRVTDLKTTSSLRWAKTAAELDDNRQLLSYVKAKFPEEKLVEISQVVVERASPYPTQQIVRIIDQNAVLEREEYDRAVIQKMLTARKAHSALDLAPAVNARDCKNWYGEPCPFYAHCKGKEQITSTGAGTLDSIWAEAHHDGRGGEGTRSALDSIAQRTNVVTEEVGMGLVQSADASVSPAPKLEVTEHECKVFEHPTLGKILTIRGEYAGQNLEFRLMAKGEYKFLDQVMWEEIQAGTKSLKKTIGGNVVYTGSAAPADILKGDGNFDIDLVRKGPLAECLKNWPVWVAGQSNPSHTPAPAPVETPKQTDPVQQIVEQTQETKQQDGQKGNLSELQALMDAGVSEGGAQRLLEQGITRSRLEAGTVSMEELLAVPKLGEVRSESLLKKFRKQSATKEPAKEPMKEPEQVKAEVKDPVPAVVQNPQPESDWSREKANLETRISELQQRLQSVNDELDRRKRFSEDLASSLDRKDEELERLKQIIEAQAPFPSAQKILYLNCLPEGKHHTLYSLLEFTFERICENLNLRDVSQIKAYDLPELVYKDLEENPPEWNALVVDTDSSEWRMTARYFVKHANLIVRSVR